MEEQFRSTSYELIIILKFEYLVTNYQHIIFMWHFFRSPLTNHFDLPGSQSIFGISQDPPMCEDTSLSQDDFFQKGIWVEYPLTSLPLWPPGSLSAGMWSRRSHDSLNEKWMRSWMRNVWSGQGPASSLICAAIFVLELQSIGNESLVALLWWVPIFLLPRDCGLCG